MANPLAITLQASTTDTVDGTGAGVDVTLDAAAVSTYPRGAAKLLLEVTAASGTTPTLDVVVETSPSGSGSWKQVGAFDQVTAAGLQRLPVAGLERYVRVSWTIGGTTPSFTFAISGDAHTIYASPDDLVSLSSSAKVLAAIPAKDMARHLLAATGLLASFVEGANEGPLTAWGDDLRLATSDVAMYHMVNSVIGHRPGEIDKSIKDRRDAAMAWAGAVKAGQQPLADTIDATPDTFEGGAFVYTDTKRGW